MNHVIGKLNQLVNTPSDINEHLPTLYKYALQCESIAELGVRGCVSSWALLTGLLHNNKPIKQLLLNDISPCQVDELVTVGRSLGVSVDYQWCNDLEVNVDNSSFDMVFIDTWHVYGQLKRELAKYGRVTRKYIAMHDTTLDEVDGETIRSNWNPEQQSHETGIPVDEILKGLRPAVDEFLRDNPQWVLEERFTNNNGLTILKRVSE
jgi:hypothetical protein